jgi:hypothetical protein
VRILAAWVLMRAFTAGARLGASASSRGGQVEAEAGAGDAGGVVVPPVLGGLFAEFLAVGWLDGADVVAGCQGGAERGAVLGVGLVGGEFGDLGLTGEGERLGGEGVPLG